MSMAAKLPPNTRAALSPAKRVAKRQGVPVSVPGQPAAADLPPLVASLRGILKKADTGAYRKHLAAKHQ
jgi:hypothetical protein